VKPVTRRWWLGAWYGVIATLVMSVAMIVIWRVAGSVMSEPIPIALVARVVARVLHREHITAAIIGLATPVHLAYGALWGALLAESTERVSWWLGAVVGLGLWLIMLIFLLPLGGEATFAAATDPRMWLATLALHLIYGVTLGALVGRHPISEASLRPD
jgi:hypothetical protein